MLNAQLAGRYAKAIFEIAVEEKKLDVFGRQMYDLAKVFVEHDDLAAFMGNVQIQPEVKKKVAAKIFLAEVEHYLYNFLLLLIEKRRVSLLPEIGRAYKVMANAKLGVIEADVTVAGAMDKVQSEQLTKKLAAITGKKVVIKTKIDQSILGGVVVRIGDKLIDGSVARQMQVLKAQLLVN